MRKGYCIRFKVPNYDTVHYGDTLYLERTVDLDDTSKGYWSGIDEFTDGFWVDKDHNPTKFPSQSCYYIPASQFCGIMLVKNEEDEQ